MKCGVLCLKCSHFAPQCLHVRLAVTETGECFGKLSLRSSSLIGSSVCVCTCGCVSTGAGCACAAHVRAKRGTTVTGIAHSSVAAGSAIAFLLSATGSVSVLVAEPLALFVRRQALEGFDGAANDVPPVDVRRTAVKAALVLSAATEDARFPLMHRAVAALVALAVARVAVKGTKCGERHVPQP